ncbi:DUF1850 domain-containing protein [Sutcliffiella horikoshii]|uniref:DUF1850 domain-containing protein n=1 Tax=Sutcliffiella horikoshii TaxID=79883 RepID=UPI001F2D6033|nr:DUF1850 domain-containing protein [Sutcliffiella horikoshii]MCG1021162.1 DUF1850 domain-containing protein [Sutcliffiella horikoshii]
MKKKRMLAIILSSTTVLLLSVLFLVPLRTALVFDTQNTGHIQAYLPINKEETFQITFTHSIHLTDVVEKYEVTDDLQILQTEIIYEEFGIGMPSNAEEGEEFVYENGKYHIKDLNNVFSSMNIRNGKTVSKNRLSWGENGTKMIWFNEYFTPGDWYNVRVEKLTLWQYMKGMKIHE